MRQYWKVALNKIETLNEKVIFFSAFLFVSMTKFQNFNLMQICH